MHGPFPPPRRGAAVSRSSLRDYLPQPSNAGDGADLSRRLSPAYPALSWDRLAAALPALPGQRPRCPLRPPAAGTGRTTVRAVASRDPPRCWLLGPQIDRLDPHGPGRSRGDFLEPQTAEETGWAAADLDRSRVGQTHQHRAVLWPGLVLVVFRLQRPPVFGWSAVETRVVLTYAAVWVIALAAWQAGRPELIRSPRLVLAHVMEGVET